MMNDMFDIYDYAFDDIPDEPMDVEDEYDIEEEVPEHTRTRAERRKNDFAKARRKAEILLNEGRITNIKNPGYLRKKPIGFKKGQKPNTGNLVMCMDGEVVYDTTRNRLGNNYKACDRRKVLSMRDKYSEYRKGEYEHDCC